MSRNTIISLAVIAFTLVSFYFYCVQLLNPSKPIHQATRYRFICFISQHLFGILMFLRFIHLNQNLDYAYWSLQLTAFNVTVMTIAQMCINQNISQSKIDNTYFSHPIQLALLNCYFLIYIYSLLGLLVSTIFIGCTKVIQYCTRSRLRRVLQRYLIDQNFQDQMVNLQCPICLIPYTANQPIVSIYCKHIFHRQCLQKWIILNNQCPLCRNDIIGDY